MPDTRSDLTAALGEHYCLERELGPGGMATVYLADDGANHHRGRGGARLRPPSRR